MQRSRKVFLWYHLPALLFAALIFGVSSVERLTPPNLGFSLSDKVYHVVEFAVFGFLVARSFRQLRPGRSIVEPLVWAALASALYGILDEIHQHFVPGRYMEALDILADVVGSVLGCAVFYVWARMRLRRTRLPGGEAGS